MSSYHCMWYTLLYSPAVKWSFNGVRLLCGHQNCDRSRHILNFLWIQFLILVTSVQDGISEYRLQVQHVCVFFSNLLLVYWLSEQEHTPTFWLSYPPRAIACCRCALHVNTPLCLLRSRWRDGLLSSTTLLTLSDDGCFSKVKGWLTFTVFVWPSFYPRQAVELEVGLQAVAKRAAKANLMTGLC